MTKTERKILDLCELINACLDMKQPVVRAAIEDQLREQTKELTDEILNKKKKSKEA